MNNSKQILKKTALIIVILGLFILSSYNPKQGPEKFTFERMQKLGTYVDLTVYAVDKASATVAADSAVYAIDNAAKIMNAYDPQSEMMIAVERAKSGPTEISNELYYILDKSLKYCELTKGAFDLTMPPLIKLWKDAEKADKIPGDELVVEVRDNMTGYEHVILTAATDDKPAMLEIDCKGLMLNINAIAKGYIADLAAAEMHKMPGVSAGMINIGGEIVCFNNDITYSPESYTPTPMENGPVDYQEGQGYDDSGDYPVNPDMYQQEMYGPGNRQYESSSIKFKIGIQDPFAVESSDVNESYSWVLELENKAVATSGNYRQYETIEGKHFSHIIDPRTGYPANHNPGVTVIAPTCMDADALATALSVLPPEEGIELIESIADTEAMIIAGTKDDNKIYRSKGFYKYNSAD